MTLTPEQELFAQTRPPIALDTFAEQMGRTPETVLRWRDMGFLEVANLNGKNYLLPETVMLFNKRLKSGEFAKDIPHIKTIRSRRNKKRTP